MSEKVLGFYEKDAGITCAECYCVYCNEAKCPNPDCGEINKEDIITFNRSELVPVRLRKESVDLKWLEEYCEINEEILKVEGTLKNHKVVRCIRVDALLCAVRAKAKEEVCEE